MRDIRKVIGFSNRFFPDISQNINEQLVLLDKNLQDLFKQTAEKSHNLKMNKRFTESKELDDFLYELSSFQEEIKDLIVVSSAKKIVNNNLKEIKCDFPLLDSNGNINDFTYTRPTAFSFENKIYVIDSFAECLFAFCEILIDKYGERFNYETINNPILIRPRSEYQYFSKLNETKPVVVKETRHFKRLSNGYYLNTTLRASNNHKLLLKLLSVFEIDHNSICFNLLKDNIGNLVKSKEPDRSNKKELEFEEEIR